MLAFSSVGDVVGPQQSLTSETFAAHLAGVRLLTGVRSIVDLEALRGLQLLTAQCTEISAPLVIDRITVSFDLMLLQHRFVLVHLIADIASMLDCILVEPCDLLVRHDQGIIMVQTIMFLQAVHIVKDTVARVTLLILHKIVHCHVRHQSLLVDEAQAANLAL